MTRKKLSTQLQQPPTEIVRGAQILAEYLTQEVPQFRDNPLNEALPPTLNPRQVTEYLLQLPRYSDKDRAMSQVGRLHMTETAREFFVPNGRHLTVYYAISNMIRRGYVRRNPVLWGYWKHVHKNIESFLKSIKAKPFPNSRARGLAIVGCGGTGKSTTVEKILQSFPQVITHVAYNGQDFIMKQLVWLKLDCPRKGSLRELCVNFFRAVDEVLLTQYEKRYAASERKSHEALITGMARVAANHCLGILVIDEIQDLSEARSGGDITMVNFFVHLENAIGVPFALIGTQDAIPILSGQFRQTRRVSEQGYIVWDRMSEVEPDNEDFDDDDDDDESATTQNTVAESHANEAEKSKHKEVLRPDPVWQNFVETLWTYQYVQEPRPLKRNVVEDKCAHALYKVAKGIPAVVQTVFVLTQQLAILTEEEKITPRLIHDAVRTNLPVIKEMLGEARMKKPRELRPVDDLADLDQIYEAEDLPNRLATGRGRKEVVNEITAEVDANVNVGVAARPKEVGIATTKSRGAIDRKASAVRSDKELDRRPKTASNDDLPSPTNRIERPKKKASGKIAKYRKSPGEYVKGLTLPKGNSL